MHGECGAVFAPRQPQDPRDIARVTVERGEVDHKKICEATVDNIFL
jgi:hypothetical protein